MSRKKILWLCSWYPGKTDRFNGDFIQRHARAASLYNDIQVIHVAGDEKGIINNKTEEEFHESSGLKEHIIYFKSGFIFFGKFMAGYRLLKLYRLAIKKYVRENGKPDLVHVQVPMKAGIVALWMKRKYKIPFVVTEHWGIYNKVVEDSYQNRNRLFKTYTKLIMGKASGFISVSRYLAEEMGSMVLKKEYHVVPNVADTDLFRYKEKAFSKFRFIHVSNMVPLKNTKGILRAFQMLLKKNNTAELLMIGDTGTCIRAYAESLGLINQSVFFYGEISYANVAKVMKDSHCLVLFSNIENSPCVIGEALCCGLPVIATNAGGIPELVDKTNAILVEPRNEEVLMKAMQQIMDNYSVYDSPKIADNAKSRFSYSVIGKKLDEIYTGIVSDKC